MNDIFIDGKPAACSPDPGAWPTMSEVMRAMQPEQQS